MATVEAQLEYITENGLAAWQTKVTQIKTDNPKSYDEDDYGTRTQDTDGT